MSDPKNVRVLDEGRFIQVKKQRTKKGSAGEVASESKVDKACNDMPLGQNATEDDKLFVQEPS